MVVKFFLVIFFFWVGNLCVVCVLDVDDLFFVLFEIVEGDELSVFFIVIDEEIEVDGGDELEDCVYGDFLFFFDFEVEDDVVLVFCFCEIDEFIVFGVEFKDEDVEIKKDEEVEVKKDEEIEDVGKMDLKDVIILGENFLKFLVYF